MQPHNMTDKEILNCNYTTELEKELSDRYHLLLNKFKSLNELDLDKVLVNVNVQISNLEYELSKTNCSKDILVMLKNIDSNINSQNQEIYDKLYFIKPCNI